MQFTGPTYHRPATVPERQYPVGVIVEEILRVLAISRWRGPMELTNFFLVTDYHYLPHNSPMMFHVEEVRANGGIVIGLLAHFTNHFGAYFHLAKSSGVGASLLHSPPTTSSPISTTSSPREMTSTLSHTSSSRTRSEWARGVPLVVWGAGCLPNMSG
ncbi:hypothetical protein D1007_30718 [Hordeum vulgare]|nr:hypothetical protein D1007_30718 [Hordeum vulgare]